MTDDKCPSFAFPAVSRKKITAAFDGGLLTSNSGVMLLAPIERRMGLARKIAALIADRRNPALITHTAEDIFRARIFAIACGYPDGNDLDWLRYDPGFMLACGRPPASGEPLCSQPTISRWENAPTLRDIIRLTYLLVDIYCGSYSRQPKAVTFDIDDTVDVVHGRQRMAIYTDRASPCHGHHDEYCFLPIHIYETATGKPVTMILRPGKTPSGKEARAWLRRLVRRIRTHWPKTRITIRGDSYYGRPEVMEFCENNGVDYFLGVSGNTILDALVEDNADDIRVRRLDNAEGAESTLRGYAETQYQAKSWKKARRVCARIEATPKGLDIRYVASSRTDGSAEYVYEVFYCARGQAENLIKLHKSQLASDRTSCRSPLANQFRLILHTAAYWLLLELRDAIPATHRLKTGEFTTLRLWLIKISSRISETASRIRISLASACPDAELFRFLAASLTSASP
jgi:hypothetical protein